jgi:hypothetical protein
MWVAGLVRPLATDTVSGYCIDLYIANFAWIDAP